MTRVLVWQWGRRGGGPRFGLNLARALAAVPGCEVLLSLSRRAELLDASDVELSGTPPLWLVETYGGLGGLLRRLAIGPLVVRGLVKRLREWSPELAICAMAGPLDLLMATALWWVKVPLVVVVHDAVPHPGDGFPFQHRLQTWLVRRANVVVALTHHVARQLEGDPRMHKPVLVASLPPYEHVPQSVPAVAASRAPGPLRLLMFGRLRAYKGLDLLAGALERLPETARFECRIVGCGPDLPELHRLAGMRGVQVENRWVPEEDIGPLVKWADVMLLPYREASQSGVGAIGAAVGHQILATQVGGLDEQFATCPGVTLCRPTAEAFANALQDILAAGPIVQPVPVDGGREAWKKMATQLLSDIRRIGSVESESGRAEAGASLAATEDASLFLLPSVRSGGRS
ncbi:glycosyltransferase [Acetobacter estunensis]|uniref:glycosyltransferase n=1 Tax=Acetobacter estunensis TaxID=104097 RepID=UPI0020C29D2C|nr:glycosyltransferase [Acetobacter estunensis]